MTARRSSYVNILPPESMLSQLSLGAFFHDTPFSGHCQGELSRLRVYTCLHSLQLIQMSSILNAFSNFPSIFTQQGQSEDGYCHKPQISETQCFLDRGIKERPLPASALTVFVKQVGTLVLSLIRL